MTKFILAISAIPGLYPATVDIETLFLTAEADNPAAFAGQTMKQLGLSRDHYTHSIQVIGLDVEKEEEKEEPELVPGAYVVVEHAGTEDQLVVWSASDSSSAEGRYVAALAYASAEYSPDEIYALGVSVMKVGPSGILTTDF